MLSWVLNGLLLGGATTSLFWQWHQFDTETKIKIARALDDFGVWFLYWAGDWVADPCEGWLHWSYKPCGERAKSAWLVGFHMSTTLTVPVVCDIPALPAEPLSETICKLGTYFWFPSMAMSFDGSWLCNSFELSLFRIQANSLVHHDKPICGVRLVQLS